MKTIHFASVCVLAFTLFSFTLGGEHYQITVNGIKAVEYFVYQKKETPTLTVSKKATTVAVMYNHCGQSSKGRVLSVIDNSNKILRKWEFENVSTLEQGEMNLDAAEVIKLITKSKETLALHYRSADLPQGRILATLKAENTSIAKAH